jgi:hypothetical protein
MNSLAGALRTSYLPPDGLAHVPAAGRSTGDGQRAADCLQWCSDRPATEGVKRFRSPLAHEPGQISRHPGAAADPLPTGPFGSRSQASGESAAQCMQIEPRTEIAKWELERSEQVYARWARPRLQRQRSAWHPGWLRQGCSSPPGSSRRRARPPRRSNKTEPLGKPVDRGHRIPPDLGSTRPFGMSYNCQVAGGTACRLRRWAAWGGMAARASAAHLARRATPRTRAPGRPTSAPLNFTWPRPQAQERTNSTKELIFPSSGQQQQDEGEGEGEAQDPRCSDAYRARHGDALLGEAHTQLIVARLAAGCVVLLAQTTAAGSNGALDPPHAVQAPASSSSGTTTGRPPASTPPSTASGSQPQGGMAPSGTASRPAWRPASTRGSSRCAAAG